MLVDRGSRIADPVVMSRVIANSFLNEMRSSHGARVDHLSVVNILRLLDIYETDAFNARKPLGILQRDDFSDLNGQYGLASFERLKSALKAAHQEYLPNTSAACFAQSVRDLLVKFDAAQGNNPETMAENTAEVDRFLSALTKSLSTV